MARPFPAPNFYTVPCSQPGLPAAAMTYPPPAHFYYSQHVSYVPALPVVQGPVTVAENAAQHGYFNRPSTAQAAPPYPGNSSASPSSMDPHHGINSYFPAPLQPTCAQSAAPAVINSNGYGGKMQPTVNFTCVPHAESCMSAPADGAPDPTTQLCAPQGIAKGSRSYIQASPEVALHCELAKAKDSTAGYGTSPSRPGLQSPACKNDTTSPGPDRVRAVQPTHRSPVGHAALTRGDTILKRTPTPSIPPTVFHGRFTQKPNPTVPTPQPHLAQQPLTAMSRPTLVGVHSTKPASVSPAEANAYQSTTFYSQVNSTQTELNNNLSAAGLDAKAVYGNCSVFSNEEAEFVRQDLYRRFGDVIHEHGPQEANSEEILNRFINLSSYERKMIMVQGSIKGFLSKCPDIRVTGNTMSLSGTQCAMLEKPILYPDAVPGQCFSDRAHSCLEALDQVPDIISAKKHMDVLFEARMSSHGITIEDPGMESSGPELAAVIAGEPPSQTDVGADFSPDICMVEAECIPNEHLNFYFDDPDQKIADGSKEGWEETDSGEEAPEMTFENKLNQTASTLVRNVLEDVIQGLRRKHEGRLNIQTNDPRRQEPPSSDDSRAALNTRVITKSQSIIDPRASRACMSMNPASVLTSGSLSANSPEFRPKCHQPVVPKVFSLVLPGPRATRREPLPLNANAAEFQVQGSGATTYNPESPITSPMVSKSGFQYPTSSLGSQFGRFDSPPPSGSSQCSSDASSPRGSELKPRSIVSVKSLRLTRICEKRRVATQTDFQLKQTLDAATNTRRGRTKDVATLSDSANTREVAINTLDSLFQPDSDSFVPITVTKDKGVGTRLAVRDVSLGTDSKASLPRETQTDGVITGWYQLVGNQEALGKQIAHSHDLFSRAVAAEEKVLQLQVELYEAELDRHLQDVHLRYLYHLRNNALRPEEQQVMESHYNRVCQGIQMQVSRIQSMRFHHSDALKQGVELSQLPPIGYMLPTMPRCLAQLTSFHMADALGGPSKPRCETDVGGIPDAVEPDDWPDVTAGPQAPASLPPDRADEGACVADTTALVELTSSETVPKSPPRLTLHSQSPVKEERNYVESFTAEHSKADEVLPDDLPNGASVAGNQTRPAPESTGADVQRAAASLGTHDDLNLNVRESPQMPEDGHTNVIPDFQFTFKMEGETSPGHQVHPEFGHPPDKPAGNLSGAMAASEHISMATEIRSRTASMCSSTDSCSTTEGFQKLPPGVNNMQSVQQKDSKADNLDAGVALGDDPIQEGAAETARGRSSKKKKRSKSKSASKSHLKRKKKSSLSEATAVGVAGVDIVSERRHVDTGRRLEEADQFVAAAGLGEESGAGVTQQGQHDEGTVVVVAAAAECDPAQQQPVGDMQVSTVGGHGYASATGDGFMLQHSAMLQHMMMMLLQTQPHLAADPQLLQLMAAQHLMALMQMQQQQQQAEGQVNPPSLTWGPDGQGRPMDGSGDPQAADDRGTVNAAQVDQSPSEPQSDDHTHGGQGHIPELVSERQAGNQIAEEQGTENTAQVNQSPAKQQTGEGQGHIPESVNPQLTSNREDQCRTVEPVDQTLEILPSCDKECVPKVDPLSGPSLERNGRGNIGGDIPMNKDQVERDFMKKKNEDDVSVSVMEQHPEASTLQMEAAGARVSASFQRRMYRDSRTPSAEQLIVDTDRHRFLSEPDVRRSQTPPGTSSRLARGSAGDAACVVSPNQRLPPGAAASAKPAEEYALKSVHTPTWLKKKNETRREKVEEAAAAAAMEEKNVDEEDDTWRQEGQPSDDKIPKSQGHIPESVNPPLLTRNHDDRYHTTEPVDQTFEMLPCSGEDRIPKVDPVAGPSAERLISDPERYRYLSEPDVRRSQTPPRTSRPARGSAGDAACVVSPNHRLPPGATSAKPAEEYALKSVHTPTWLKKNETRTEKVEEAAAATEEKNVDDEDDKWREAGAKWKKKMKGAPEMPHMAQSAVSATKEDASKSFEKLVKRLMDWNPTLSRQDAIEVIQLVRNKRMGLKGVQVSQILEDARLILKDRAKKDKAKVAAAPPSSSAAANSYVYRTQICQYWKAGSCSKVRDCLYAHGKHELQSLPKTIFCDKMKKTGHCPYDTKCIFAHTKAELAAAVPPRRTTTLQLGEVPVSVQKKSKRTLLTSVKGASFWGEDCQSEPDLSTLYGRESKAQHAIPGSIYNHVLSDDDHDGEICVVCCDAMPEDGAYKLDCGHEFHEQCIKRWLKGQGERTCPTCRNHALLEEDFPKLG